MKKILSLCLAVLMLAACVSAFASCGESGEKKMKVGFIFLHDENSTYDNNFLQAAKAACEAKGVEMVVKKNIPESSKCKDAADDLVAQGCTVVFADSFGHEDFMIQAAKEHKDAAGLKLNEMIAAGKFTAEEAVMGYVGAFTYAEVISGYTSFYLGAKSVCPSVTMKVTFTGSWYDETKEKEAANKLISQGCKLISQHADSMGAPKACEEAGIPNVSYNGSTKTACPKTFIVSSRINWQPYFEYMIQQVKDGKKIDTDWTGTLANGAVVLTEINETAAAAGTKEAIEKAEASLKKGELHVFDINTFTVGGQKLTSYMADVDTDPEFKKDTEVVENGYFNESGKRSAPYFDVQIDGITLLDQNFGS